MMMQSNEEITFNEIFTFEDCLSDRDVKFTFEDWLSYRMFYYVEYGVQMCNDSGNFCKLLTRKMDIPTLNKIQNEQAIIYEGLVEEKLDSLKLYFRVRYVRESVEPLEFLRMKIEDVEKYLKVTERDTYSDIVSKRKERGIKYGAKFISPCDYYDYHNIVVGRRTIIPDSYEGLIRNDDKKFIFGRNIWVEVEARYYFLKWLKRLQEGEFSFGFSDDNRVIELSTPPALKGIGQGKVNKEQKGGNRLTQLQKQNQIDILKKAVNELCNQNRGKQKNDRLNVPNILKKALLTEKLQDRRTLDRHIKDLNLSKTTLQYIGQLVRQYCTDNSLSIRYFDLQSDNLTKYIFKAIHLVFGFFLCPKNS